MGVKPRSFSQAAMRKHTRHGPRYDPEAAKRSPAFAIGMAFATILFLGAGFGLYIAFHSKSVDDQAKRDRVTRSQQLLVDFRQYRAAHKSDDQVEAVQAYIQDRRKDILEAESWETQDLLRQLDAQKQQREFRKQIDRLLSDVRALAKRPEDAVSMRDKAAQLEKLLGLLDDDRQTEVKNEIFLARGTSAIAAAEKMMTDAQALEAAGERNYGRIMEAYEKADKELADVLVAQKFPKAKDIHDEIGMKLNDLGERWAESSSGFSTMAPRNLLDPREFTPVTGSDKAPWQVSPGAKMSFSGKTLVIEGVKPEKAQGPGERAGIAFWSPSPDQSIHHYELKLRVKIVKVGFSLLGRQSSGYARHLHEFEALPPDKNAGDNFYPVEGHTYDIVERIFGKKVKIDVTPADGDEPLPSAIETTTLAREGGVGFMMKVGAKIEIESASIKILR